MPALFLLALQSVAAQNYAAQNYYPVTVYPTSYAMNYYPSSSSYYPSSTSTYCYTSSSCAFGQTCIGGVCLQSRGGGGQLQSCSFDYECNAQQVCSGNVCVSRNWQCTRNSQCRPDEACLGGTCQALYSQTQPASGYWCNLDAQCSVYEKCQDYHCRRCNVGECLNRGSLNPCWHDEQCNLAEICADGLCRTKPCKTDNQCGYTEVCDPTMEICVDCTSQFAANNGVSVPYDSQYYGSYSGSCVGTGSGYWCYADSQCPAGEICDNSKCRSNNPMTPFVCTVDSQCGYNRRCNNGLCVPTMGPYPGGIGGIIPPCQTDSDCDYNKVCQSGQCIDGGYAPWVPHN